MSFTISQSFYLIVLQCFQAGEICGKKCKCVSCSNHAGSQKLIDKRRKMKDTKGADYAMKISKELWERGKAQRQKGPPQLPPQRLSIASPGGLRSPMASMRSPEAPMSRGMPPPPPQHPHGGFPPPFVESSVSGPAYRSRSPFMTSPVMGGRVGFSPMGPGMGGFEQHGISPPAPRKATSAVTAPKSATKKSIKKVTPATAPRTPGVRLQFDPAVSRQKRRRGDQEEPLALFFGNQVRPQPKTVALTVFSFLADEDFLSASLVCKEWSRVAMDRELWKFGDRK